MLNDSEKDLMGKKRKKRRRRVLTIEPLELFRSIRKPMAPRTRVFKDKKRYSRKVKHSKDWREER